MTFVPTSYLYSFTSQLEISLKGNVWIQVIYDVVTCYQYDEELKINVEDEAFN